jgi:hypothetical protein
MKKDFVVCDGKIYVKKSESGISQLTILTDGFMWHCWKNTEPCLLVDDVLAWYKKEITHTKNKKQLELLNMGIAHFERAKKVLA